MQNEKKAKKKKKLNKLISKMFDKKLFVRRFNIYIVRERRGNCFESKGILLIPSWENLFLKQIIENNILEQKMTRDYTLAVDGLNEN